MREHEPRIGEKLENRLDEYRVRRVLEREARSMRPVILNQLQLLDPFCLQPNSVRKKTEENHSTRQRQTDTDRRQTQAELRCEAIPVAGWVVGLLLVAGCWLLVDDCWAVVG